MRCPVDAQPVVPSALQALAALDSGDGRVAVLYEQSGDVGADLLDELVHRLLGLTWRSLCLRGARDRLRLSWFLALDFAVGFRRRGTALCPRSLVGSVPESCSAGTEAGPLSSHGLRSLNGSVDGTGRDGAGPAVPVL